jgi:hypothetical protein
MLNSELIEGLQKMRTVNYKRMESTTGIYPIIVPAPKVDRVIANAIRILKRTEQNGK